MLVVICCCCCYEQFTPPTSPQVCRLSYLSLIFVFTIDFVALWVSSVVKKYLCFAAVVITTSAFTQRKDFSGVN